MGPEQSRVSTMVKMTGPIEALGHLGEPDRVGERLSLKTGAPEDHRRLMVADDNCAVLQR